MPLLGELTASEAARFFGFTASAEVSCETMQQPYCAVLQSGIEGGDGADDEDGAAVSLRIDEEPSSAVIRRAVEAAAAMLQQQTQQTQQVQQQQQPAPLMPLQVLQLQQLAVQQSGAGELNDANKAGVKAARREEVVGQWQQQQQQQQLRPRARALLVLFCNR